jgi:hypothetical protein
MAKYTNDLEDSSQLDADEAEAFEFWATKQKDLVRWTPKTRQLAKVEPCP